MSYESLIGSSIFDGHTEGGGLKWTPVDGGQLNVDLHTEN